MGKRMLQPSQSDMALSQTNSHPSSIQPVVQESVPNRLAQKSTV